MTTQKIKFGTDGWRAIISEDFIPSNIEKVIQAFCDCPLTRPSATLSHKGRGEQGEKIILGYDRRNQSPESARLVAEVLAGNGFTVMISNQFCPTPCVSWMTKVNNALAGIVITASHNPSNWNGVKFKESYGGSAAPEYTNEIEKQIAINDEKNRQIVKINFDEGVKKGLIVLFDPKKTYVEHLRSLLDIQKIQKSGLKILNDPLFGAGTHFMQDVLQMPVDSLHTAADTTFGGLNPEPIDKNLGELMGKMKTGAWSVGLATDGDADRIGAVDENGNFVNSHLIFALLLKHYVENKKLKGTIVKSLSTTQMINKLCEKYGLECVETPIGFKHICKILVEKNALMGGEESGGLSFEPHVHERDGVLNGLFLVEMMAMTGKNLSELIQDLFKEVGNFYFDRIDLHLEREAINKLQKKLSDHPPTIIDGKKISRIDARDGFKYVLEDGSWLLIRASGTEPLVRIYSEASSTSQVQSILAEGKAFLD